MSGRHPSWWWWWLRLLTDLLWCARHFFWGHAFLAWLFGPFLSLLSPFPLCLIFFIFYLSSVISLSLLKFSFYERVALLGEIIRVDGAA